HPQNNPASFPRAYDHSHHGKGNYAVSCVDGEERERPALEEVMRSDKHRHPTKTSEKSVECAERQAGVRSQEHRQVHSRNQREKECESKNLPHVSRFERLLCKSVFPHPDFTENRR